MNHKDMKEIFKELRRKAFHILALVFPIFYAFSTQEQLLTFVVPLMAIAVVLDAQRKSGNGLAGWINKIFGNLMRPHEQAGGLSGASYMLLGVTITVVLFSKVVAVTALLILVMADSFSAIIGKVFGRRRCCGMENKTWEGVAAFTVTSWVLIMFVNGITGSFPNAWLLGIFVGFAVALVEVASSRFRIDDNILIPISAGIFLTPFCFS